MELSNDPDKARSQLKSILENIAALKRGEARQPMSEDTETLIKNCEDGTTNVSALQPDSDKPQHACIDMERDRQRYAGAGRSA